MFCNQKINKELWSGCHSWFYQPEPKIMCHRKCYSVRIQSIHLTRLDETLACFCISSPMWGERVLDSYMVLFKVSICSRGWEIRGLCKHLQFCGEFQKNSERFFFPQYEQQHIEGITKGFSFLVTQNTLTTFSIGNTVIECCFLMVVILLISKVMLPNKFSQHWITMLERRKQQRLSSAAQMYNYILNFRSNGMSGWN